MAEPCVIVVDAYSTGRYIASAWHHHFPLIHVASSAEMPAVFSSTLASELFARQLTYSGDLEQLLAQLSGFNIAYVVCGSEYGVELTDQLAQRLALPGNNATLAHCRRDKFAMHTQLIRHGIPCGRVYRATTPAVARRLYARSNLPVMVVKPLDSAGSEDVYICRDAHQVAEAAHRILGKTNLMQAQNHSVLLQEYLEGDEYVINTVSADGQHYVCDLWRSGKRRVDGERLIYDYETLLSPQHSLVGELMAYTRQVLDSLGITWGPAHSELILTAAGPRLLETAGRVSGLANPAALDRATGHNQISLSVDAYVRPQRWGTELGHHYQRHAHCYCVNLIAPASLTLDQHHLLRELKELRSYHSSHFRATAGQVRRTVDLNTSPGVVYLVHESEDQIMMDYHELRRLENRHYHAARISA
ncbi:MAG: ATP-grasp domain-containing protein [Wenzhouxiangellaceae bacterium]